MKVALLALALLLGSGLTRSAEAQHVHVVEPGETLASIAQLYYGDPKKERALRLENHLDAARDLVPGLRLQIPFVTFHRVVEGETWANLAARYYGDERRDAALRHVNRGGGEAPEIGAELLIPPTILFVAQGSEMVPKLARAHLGKQKDGAVLLRLFNPGLGNKVEKGALVLVPRADLRLSSEGRDRVIVAGGAAPSEGAVRDRQARVSIELPILVDHVRGGRYIEAIVLGNRLLGIGELTGNQSLTIHRSLGTAYVALDRADLALQAFLEALELQPDLELDSLRTSPRVQKVFRIAREQRESASSAATERGQDEAE